jgi:hypothetical protein
MTDQKLLNQALYDNNSRSLDTIEKEKPIKYSKKPLGYNDNFFKKIFRLKINNKKSLGKEKTKLFGIFKKRKKMTYFNKL